MRAAATQMPTGMGLKSEGFVFVVIPILMAFLRWKIAAG